MRDERELDISDGTPRQFGRPGDARSRSNVLILSSLRIEASGQDERIGSIRKSVNPYPLLFSPFH